MAETKLDPRKQLGQKDNFVRLKRREKGVRPEKSKGKGAQEIATGPVNFYAGSRGK